MISSRQHPIVKEFRELARGAGPLMLLDGWHLLGEAAAARIDISARSLFYRQKEDVEFLH